MISIAEIRRTTSQGSAFKTWRAASALIGLNIFANRCLHPNFGPRALPDDRAVYAESLAGS